MAVNYDAMVEHWKSKLLDLSMRNRLLNMAFKKTGSVVRIALPDGDLLWDRLVTRELSVTFARRTRMDAEREIADYERARTEAEEKGAALADITRPSPFSIKETEAVLQLLGADQQKRLKAIRSQARSIAEERGINLLYAAIGAVRWIDRKKEEHLAPLLLVPVDLTIRSKNSPYVMVRNEDDPSVNETFALKAKRDYDIDIPQIEEGETPRQYFGRVEAAVARVGWSVEPCAALGIFLFATINMYHDLVENKDLITANRNVRAICGDVDSCDAAPKIIDGDEISAGGTSVPLKILDSDSSQDRAVEWANAGVSFVLQGPPGTGKSQTIANIIGESLYLGKKVLFVSEKRAALDVVKRRLEKAGLIDWALVLHDLKSNKKEAVDDLARQLEGLHGARSTGTTQSDRRYQKVKGELDAYAREVYEQKEPLGISVWEAFGELARLRSAPSLFFALDDAMALDQHGLDEMREAIRGLEIAIAGAPEGIESGPWRGIRALRLTEDSTRSILRAVQAAGEAGAELERAAGRCASVLPLDESAVIAAGADGVLRALDACVGFSGVRAELRANPNLRGVLASARRIREVQREAAPCIDGFSRMLDEVRSAGLGCGLAVPDAIDEAALVGMEAELDAAIADDALLSAVITRPELAPQLQKLAEQLESYRAARDEVLSEYTNEIFDLDCRGMLLRAEQGYASGFKRLFSAEFKQDALAISRCARRVTAQKMGYEQLKAILHRLDDTRVTRAVIGEMLDELGDSVPQAGLDGDTDPSVLARVGRLSALVASLKPSIGSLAASCRSVSKELKVIESCRCFAYRGLQTDLGDVDETQRLLDGVVGAAAYLGCDGQTMLASPACRERSPQDLESIRDGFLSASGRWERARITVLGFFQEDAALASRPFDQALSILASCTASESDLAGAVAYERAIEACRKVGLSGFVDAAEQGGCDSSELLPAFERRFYTLWVERASEALPAVSDFIEAEQERRIDEFDKLDDYELKRAQDRIIASLRRRAADGISDDDVRILRHEAAKSKRIKPLRKLMEEIPGLVTTLKPCMMMSPLSVSTFLKSRSIAFDLVIFDEGSQVRTEYAVGAISRGGQVIIGGDSKQLPPSNFFTAAAAGDDDLDANDEDAVVDEFDSVLDEASMMPATTLRWHYRSLNETLIAFSNKEIYNGDLVTFPSGREGAADEGVSFIHVSDGIWEGTGEGNPIEARRVAELVLEHYEKHPDRSLGVIAFGSGQMNAIESALNELRKKHVRYERFFDEGGSEPFFIKSLENVQGDERDAIILSVGYARSSTGTFAMRFGPISQLGGERRLNVAVTRAKRSLTLVSSVTELDFNLSEEARRGPSLLRDYIAFARRCAAGLLDGSKAEGLDEPVQGVRSETPLMDYLVQVVEGLGLVAVREVGETKNRVDVGVKLRAGDPCYIAGIVTDGPSYHAARTTRERELIRPSMLANMGWNLYNVWAPAWGRDPMVEAERLRSFLREAVAERGQSAEADEAGGAGSREEPDAAVDEPPLGASSSMDEERSAEAVGSDAREEGASGVSDDRAAIKPRRPSRRVAIARDEVDGGCSFEPYVAAKGLDQRLGFSGYLRAIARLEAPISLNLLYRDAAVYRGEPRVDTSVKARVLDLFDKDPSKEFLVVKDFVYIAGTSAKQLVPRRKGRRTFADIAPMELEASVLVVLTACFSERGARNEELYAAVMKAFGFGRVTDLARLRLASAVSSLKRSGLVRSSRGRLLAV